MHSAWQNAISSAEAIAMITCQFLSIFKLTMSPAVTLHFLTEKNAKNEGRLASFGENINFNLVSFLQQCMITMTDSIRCTVAGIKVVE